jgi:hypothetical protein
LNEWSTGKYVDLSVLNNKSQTHYQTIEDKVKELLAAAKEKRPEAWISLSASVYASASHNEIPDTTDVTSHLLSSLSLVR